MSQDVSLKAKDYTNLLKWYEFSFGKGNDPTPSDSSTFTKISVMAMAYAEEIKELEGDTEQDDEA